MSKVADYYQKLKQTKKERFGDENYNNREKATATMLDLYGVEHALQNEEILNRLHNNNIEKYGKKIFNNQEKSKITNLGRYGVEYIFQNKTICPQNSKLPFDDLLLNNKLEENNLLLIDEYSGHTYSNRNNIHYQFQCKICDNVFTATFAGYKSPICRKCFPMKSSTKPNLIINKILDEIEIEYISNTKYIISPYELDFYIPEHKIAIEVNGNYWHSELNGTKDRYYHLNKSILCNDKGIKLGNNPLLWTKVGF